MVPDNDNGDVFEQYKKAFDFYLNWTYAGVDFSIEGTGGQECVDFIPSQQKVIETIAISVLSLTLIAVAYSRLKLPVRMPPVENRDRTGKKVMLVVMCLTFGCEIGFKLASKQMIWILNPCHMVTACQVCIAISSTSVLGCAFDITNVYIQLFITVAAQFLNQKT